MIIFLDTETTGLYPGYICQLSYVIQDGKNLTGKNFFFSVPFVDYSAFMLHGFSVENLKFLSGGRNFGDNIEEIEQDFKRADVICTHNTAFDFMFLRAEFERYNKTFSFNREYCSMKKSVALCKIPRAKSLGYKYPKLSELCNFLYLTDVEIRKVTDKLFEEAGSYHDARFDTCAVYLAVNTAIQEGYMQELKEFL